MSRVPPLYLKILELCRGLRTSCVSVLQKVGSDSEYQLAVKDAVTLVGNFMALAQTVPNRPELQLLTQQLLNIRPVVRDFFEKTNHLHRTKDLAMAKSNQAQLFQPVTAAISTVESSARVLNMVEPGSALQGTESAPNASSTYFAPSAQFSNPSYFQPPANNNQVYSSPYSDIPPEASSSSFASPYWGENDRSTPASQSTTFLHPMAASPPTASPILRTPYYSEAAASYERPVPAAATPYERPVPTVPAATPYERPVPEIPSVYQAPIMPPMISSSPPVLPSVSPSLPSDLYSRMKSSASDSRPKVAPIDLDMIANASIRENPLSSPKEVPPALPKINRMNIDSTSPRALSPTRPLSPREWVSAKNVDSAENTPAPISPRREFQNRVAHRAVEESPRVALQQAEPVITIEAERPRVSPFTRANDGPQHHPRTEPEVDRPRRDSPFAKTSDSPQHLSKFTKTHSESEGSPGSIPASKRENLFKSKTVSDVERPAVSLNSRAESQPRREFQNKFSKTVDGELAASPRAHSESTPTKIPSNEHDPPPRRELLHARFQRAAESDASPTHSPQPHPIQRPKLLKAASDAEQKKLEAEAQVPPVVTQPRPEFLHKLKSADPDKPPTPPKESTSMKPTKTLPLSRPKKQTDSFYRPRFTMRFAESEKLVLDDPNEPENAEEPELDAQESSEDSDYDENFVNDDDTYYKNRYTVHFTSDQIVNSLTTQSLTEQEQDPEPEEPVLSFFPEEFLPTRPEHKTSTAGRPQNPFRPRPQPEPSEEPSPPEVHEEIPTNTTSRPSGSTPRLNIDIDDSLSEIYEPRDTDFVRSWCQLCQSTVPNDWDSLSRTNIRKAELAVHALLEKYKTASLNKNSAAIEKASKLQALASMEAQQSLKSSETKRNLVKVKKKRG